MQVTAPDLTEHSEFITSGGFRIRRPAQKCYDLALDCLRAQFTDCRPLWSLTSAKRWGAKPANDKQKDYLKRLSQRKRVDISAVMPDLTMLQAATLIEKLKG